MFLFFNDCRTDKESQNMMNLLLSTVSMNFKAISIAFTSAEKIEELLGRRSFEV